MVMALMITVLYSFLKQIIFFFIFLNMFLIETFPPPFPTPSPSQGPSLHPIPHFPFLLRLTVSFDSRISFAIRKIGSSESGGQAEETPWTKS